MKVGKAIYSKTGDIYEGEWFDGKPEGKGTKIWSDKRKYVGEFFAGKPCGIGSKYSKEGEETKGYWVGGKFFEGPPQPGILEK